jgi:uncharacterized phage infection (PIP) family protein YhgE
MTQPTPPIDDNLVKAIAAAIAMANNQPKPQYIPPPNLDNDKKLALDTSPLFNAKNILNWIVVALVLTFSATTVYNEIVNKINKNDDVIVEVSTQLKSFIAKQENTNERVSSSIDALKDASTSSTSRIGVLNDNFTQITRKMDGYEEKLDKYMADQSKTTTSLSNQMADIERLITNLDRKK